MTTEPTSTGEGRPAQWGAPPPGWEPSDVRIDGRQVRFRDFRPGDEQQIVDVLRASFGEFYPADKPVDEAGYIAWFAEPHESHTGWVVVGELDSRIVSATGQLLRRIRTGDRLLEGQAGGIASATHPEFQGRGLNLGSRDWMRAARARLPDAAVERSRLTPRWDRRPLALAAGIGVYLRVLKLRPERGSRRSLKAIAWPALAAWGALRASLPHPAPRVTLRTIDTFDEPFEVFLQEASRGWDFIPERTREYLNWRFCDPRAGRFVVRVAEREGAPLGYAALHRVGERGHVVDLLTLPGRLDVARALIDDATAWFKRDGASELECWMHRRHPYTRLLHRAGFVLLRRATREIEGEIKLFERSMTDDERAGVESADARIHLVRADFDGI